MRVRYKNNMTGREIIGQKRLLFTTKPAFFKKELLHILCAAVPFGFLVFAVLFQIHGGGGESEIHAVFLHQVHQVEV